MDLAPSPARAVDDPPKKRQILEGARQVFLENGFDGASMDEIARIAGVSKGTLYTYFNNKAALFEHLIWQDRSGLAEQCVQLDPDNPDIRGELIALGLNLVERIMSPHNIALTRVGIAATAKFPDIGRILYDAGPERGITRLSAYLEELSRRGKLRVEDPRLAAMQALALAKISTLKPMLYGGGERPDAGEVMRAVSSGVDMFLNTYKA